MNDHCCSQERIAPLEERLGYVFMRKELLHTALTHRSFFHSNRKSAENNERLEFLGDSVLGLIISHYLLESFPAQSEGKLSKIRSFIVNEKTLSRVAREKIQLGRYLFIGKGEENTGGRNKASILADAMEAVVAAIYLDGGLNAARNVILELMSEEIESTVFSNRHRDYKTELQELSQGSLSLAPEYRVEREWGPDHQKHFAVSLYLHDQVYGHGEGTSKKSAEQKAARAAMEKLRAELEKKRDEVTG
ncbi:ribonuclease III [Desulfurispirillum indicum]|uniref:ribonuclease III n=1 Tax=Desulfurispirillum indicum TaxID=936456 RepID=UPI001CFA1BB7|nr:ribonuclease III [Desulfurispirillum indicum]UCZ57221.1 ribonuclease III [Desulfurispirillum indicum]